MAFTGRCSGVPRADSAKKFVGILSLVVAILCLVSSMALANPSTGTTKAADATIKTGISIAYGTGQQDRGHPQLHKVPFIDGMLSTANKQERNLAGKGRISLSLAGQDEDCRQVLSNLTLRAGKDASGYDCKSHMLLMKPVERLAPTIFVVEERSSNGELYLGLLSLMIPW